MTTITLLTGTFALVSIDNFKNLLGTVVPAPEGMRLFTPEDPSIVTITPQGDSFAFTAGATGSTTVKFSQGTITVMIAVEVVDFATPSSVDLTVGPVTAVPPDADSPAKDEVHTGF